ncbi:MAG: ATP-binding protein [Sneathiella sp.]
MRNKLTIKLVMLLVVITTSVMAIFIGLRLWINWYEYNQEIDARFERVSARIATTVNPTIWDIYKKSLDRNYSQEVAKAILDAELKDPHLVAIKVYGNFGHLFMGKIKLADGTIVDFDNTIFKGVLERVDRRQRYPIRLGEMTIGNVEIFFTEAPLRQRLLRSFLLEIIQTIFVGLVVILFLFYALRKSLVKPMIALQTAKHAIESMSDGVAILAPSGQILEINNSLSEQTGYDISELINKKLFIFKNTSNADDKMEHIWQSVKNKGFWSGEVETIRKNETLYPSMLSLTTVYSDDGKIINRVMVLHDNTNERRLQHTQRMDTVGALAGGVAHDINNVLTPIMGWAELLSEDMSDPETSHRGIQQILKGTERAKGMINQIMNFSRISETSEPFDIDLKALILDSIGFIGATIPASIRIDTNLCKEELRVFGDPGKIEQVLINLYTNAMHAMEEKGGVLTISADLEDVFSEQNSSKRIHIIVSDTGHGIPKDILESIFEPYFTTKGSGKGNGFGLSTSIGIINMMDGDLRAETEIGIGSTFHVSLPAFVEHLEFDDRRILNGTLAVEDGKGSIPFEALTDVRVMLVDDEIDNLRLVESMLERLGCQTVSYQDSNKALSAFTSEPDMFDILITDQSMPHLQGHELVSAIRSIVPDLPIAVITGHNLVETEEKYRALDGVAYIRKPFRIQEIRSAINKLLHSSSTLERNL